jgi:two-component system, NtrC family, response regulator HydG
MSRFSSLNTIDRSFFRQVAKLTFGNPFSTDRLVSWRELTGETNDDREQLVAKAIDSVRDRIEKIDALGKINIKRYGGEDRELVRVALLFDIYMRFRENFDALILAQIGAGDEHCPAPFAKDAFALLMERGFSQEESRRYFSIFYQLRRAWYFIHHGLIGKSPCMETLRSHLWNNIFTSDPRWYEKYLWSRMEDFSTFLIGETGTGKGAAAAAIGRSSFIPFDEKKGQFAENFTGNFIEINLSQFSESLIESELFGHQKGAFTGAIANHKGVFSRCSPHGAIFLDEVGDVSIPVQIKLLNVVQERRFLAVGSHDESRFHGRVIAATNKALDELRRQGLFRDDLYYRLCSDMVSLPPLRQQIKEDPEALEYLLGHTINRMIGEPAPELLHEVKGILEKEVGPNYPWPGNVRELEQAVRRILITRHYNGDMRALPVAQIGHSTQDSSDGEMSAQELIASHCAKLYNKHGTFEKVAQITKLDPRTVKKYIQKATGQLRSG